MKYICSICGYIHNGENPPEQCPNCGADKAFTQTAEHENLLKIHFEKLVDAGDENKVNMCFGNYSGIQPFIYNLPAGRHIPLHKHPTTDELFFIIKGRFEFTIGDNIITADEGDLVQGVMNIPHSFRNISDSNGIFLSVKGPKPVDTEIIKKE